MPLSSETRAIVQMQGILGMEGGELRELQREHWCRAVHTALTSLHKCVAAALAAGSLQGEVNLETGVIAAPSAVVRATALLRELLKLGSLHADALGIVCAGGPVALARVSKADRQRLLAGGATAIDAMVAAVTAQNDGGEFAPLSSLFSMIECVDMLALAFYADVRGVRTEFNEASSSGLTGAAARAPRSPFYHFSIAAEWLDHDAEMRAAVQPMLDMQQLLVPLTRGRKGATSLALLQDARLARLFRALSLSSRTLVAVEGILSAAPGAKAARFVLATTGLYGLPDGLVKAKAEVNRAMNGHEVFVLEMRGLSAYVEAKAGKAAASGMLAHLIMDGEAAARGEGETKGGDGEHGEAAEAAEAAGAANAAGAAAEAAGDGDGWTVESATPGEAREMRTIVQNTATALATRLKQWHASLPKLTKMLTSAGAVVTAMLEDVPGACLTADVRDAPTVLEYLVRELAAIATTMPAAPVGKQGKQGKKKGKKRPAPAGDAGAGAAESATPVVPVQTELRLAYAALTGRWSSFRACVQAMAHVQQEVSRLLAAFAASEAVYAVTPEAREALEAAVEAGTHASVLDEDVLGALRALISQRMLTMADVVRGCNQAPSVGSGVIPLVRVLAQLPPVGTDLPVRLEANGTLVVDIGVTGLAAAPTFPDLFSDFGACWMAPLGSDRLLHPLDGDDTFNERMRAALAPGSTRRVVVSAVQRHHFLDTSESSHGFPHAYTTSFDRLLCTVTVSPEAGGGHAVMHGVIIVRWEAITPATDALGTLWSNMELDSPLLDFMPVLEAEMESVDA